MKYVTALGSIKVIQTQNVIKFQIEFCWKTSYKDTIMNTITITIANCLDCKNHLSECDPDPYDSFNGDDMAVLCVISPNVDHKKHYAGNLGEFRFKPITLSARPYNLRKECDIPDWCPLLPPSEKHNGEGI